MTLTAPDIPWLTGLAAGLDAAREQRRLLLLHPCGQGIGDADDL